MTLLSPLSIQLMALALGIVTLFAIMWSDSRYFRIPNSMVFILFLDGILFAFFTHHFQWLLHGAALALIFGICYALFHFGFLGGGDTKLIPVMAFWVGFADLLPFLLMMTGAGAVLAISMAVVSAVRTRNLSANDEAKSAWRKKRMPYGVAIGLAGVFFFVKTAHHLLGL